MREVVTAKRNNQGVKKRSLERKVKIVTETNESFTCSFFPNQIKTLIKLRVVFQKSKIMRHDII